MSLMKILVVGNGGREHAIAWRLAQSASVEKVYVAPGNGGTLTVGPKVENVPHLSGSRLDFEKLKQFAVDNQVSLVVPGPEQPLVDGISTVFTSVGIPVFGPLAKAATMEGSKAFSKVFMAKHNIPTARFKNFTDVDAAREHIRSVDYKIVLKADGIAAGKGVLIPETTEEALAGLDEIMVAKNFGSAGDEIVIEEFLEGDELSILTITDGYSFFNLPAAQDHKRAGDGDTGLNTGGMGAYAPAPIATPAVLAKINEQVIRPTIDGMRKDGYPMCGVLFTGIMLTPSKEPKVLEYNVRFGDPETQTVLPLLTADTDLAQVMLAAAEHRLDSVLLATQDGVFSTTVVMAAGGYPDSYKKGDAISIAEPADDTYIFHAGTDVKNGQLVTSGGRVIALTATGSSIRESVDRAYAGVDKVTFTGKYNRRDIAHRAFRDSAVPQGSTYAEAGVSVDNGNLLVDQIKKKVKLTARAGADSDIGGFGGLFDLKAAGYDSSETLLVAATDGVGTKLRIAQIADIHDTVGIDLVAMNVNDLVVQGAEPLIFLDYFATGKLDVEVAAKFVSGVADGCIIAGCALVGGETSEMPGMYDEGHYDTNGTAVGAVYKDKILPKIEHMAEGDVLIGLKSDGVHSNGFSLVRHIITKLGLDYNSPAPWPAAQAGNTIAQELLVPTKIYVKQLLPAIRKDLLLGMAHITGGGLVENIPRALPKHLQARVDISQWQVPEIFKWFGKAGGVPVADWLKTFNVGVGMVVIVSADKKDAALAELHAAGEDAVVIGELVARNDGPGCVVENADGLY